MDAHTSSPVSAPILVAFGHEGLRHSVRMWLNDAGYEVVETTATAGTIAYLHFALVSHIVLLDYQLPPGTAEPLLHIVERDAALQRHRFILSLRPDRLVPMFSVEAERLIRAHCAAILEDPLEVEQLRAAIERGSSVTAPQGIDALQLPGHLRPGTVSAALARVASRLRSGSR